MNETERRRKKLLEQTRNLYQDDRVIPAVHPRYKTSYQHLYSEKFDLQRGTLGIRCMFCLIIFIAYVMLERNHLMFYGINDLQIREMIMHNLML